MRTDNPLRTGVLVGIAGGLAEILVVGARAALIGADASPVARGIAETVGLTHGSVAGGLAVHMALAVMLGVALIAIMRLTPVRFGAARRVAFMVLGLAAVWALNFLVVLPAIGSDFARLLPAWVSFASKLSFGLAGAATLTWIGSMGAARRFAVRGGAITGRLVDGVGNTRVQGGFRR